MTLPALPTIARFEAALAHVAPFMAGAVGKGRARFGREWEDAFEVFLSRFFGGDDAAMELAIKGYVGFSLEMAKLQKRFETERVYAAKTYAEAAAQVYHNEEYVNSLYAPGILLSHYLWPHYFSQLRYFHNRFAALVLASGDQRFCEVGVGSGFYSRQLLSLAPDVRGHAFDISAHSLDYTARHLERFGVRDRWAGTLRDMIAEPVDETWPFIVSADVLEHLEDPPAFLRSLRRMLRPGGTGFIATVITSANTDHIYLYNSWEEIRDQLADAGFRVLDHQEDIAYEPRADEPVPRLAAFIVT
ncbi:methyltransferase [Azospirillum sp.]|uniref:class I SAM-dependent methyltransferase n=1 Tax=Azospirillum sp. TaxID=34012 RepID=UPI003D7047FE